MLLDIKYNDLFENIKENNKTYSDYNNAVKNAQNFEKTVHTCLHCGNDTPLYCEKCQQELIIKNAELQLESNQLKRKIFDLYNSSGEYEKAKSIMTKELKDYIPKQVIKDKLENLKECNTSCLVEQIYNNGKKSLCKELLGE